MRINEIIKESLKDEVNLLGKVVGGKRITEQLDKWDGAFVCEGMGLTSLRYCPTHVAGDFVCDENKLASLDYGPETVVGSYWCNSMSTLKSLSGCPTNIDGTFWCSYTDIESLIHCPSTVGVNFWCYWCKLFTLEHCPKKVGGDFYCWENPFSHGIIHIMNCDLGGKFISRLDIDSTVNEIVHNKNFNVNQKKATFNFMMRKKYVETRERKYVAYSSE